MHRPAKPTTPKPHIRSSLLFLALVLLAAPLLGAEDAMNPGLAWSRYLGGAGGDEASRVVADGQGGLWVAGRTTDVTSWDTAGVTPVRIGGGGGTDMFLARLGPEGQVSRLIFVGGTGYDVASDLAVVPGRGVVVAGTTSSADFPGVDDAQPGETVAVAFEVGDDGALGWATALGGSSLSGGVSVALTPDGSVALAGTTSSSGFPLLHPLSLSMSLGVSHGFIAVLAGDTGALRFSTLLGGSGEDRINALAAGPDGTLTVVGDTFSEDFPVTNPVQPAFGGSSGCDGDAFVATVAWQERALVFSSYLGGSLGEVGDSVTVDGAGRLTVLGETTSTDFPWTAGSYLLEPGGISLFISRVGTSPPELDWAAGLPLLPPGDPLGGGVLCLLQEGRFGVALDSLGRVWVAGRIGYAGFPLVDPIDSHLEHADAFVSVLASDGASLVFSTYLGGSGSDGAVGVSIVPDGGVIVAGSTDSADFPSASGSYHGGGDVFVARISTDAAPLTASAAASPGSGLAPLTVNFSAGASGGTGVYDSYSWDFGDGSPHASGKNPSHTYTVGGTYTATLTVTDSMGATASAPVEVTVEATCSIGCTATAPLMTSVLGTTTLEPVPFSATASPSSDCPLTPAFLWEFGDGTTSTEQNPHHAYPEPGIYDWTLTVTLAENACYRHGTVAVTDLSGFAGMQVIPATAHNPGIGGTLWRTDVTAVNRGASPAGVAFVYVTGEGRTLRSATIPAGGTVEWPDILASLFGIPMTATGQGTLQVASDRPVALVARTYDETTEGTLGAAYPALGPADGVTSGETGILSGLKSSTGFRTNLGLVNLGGSDCQARVTLYAATGEALGTPLALSVPGGQWIPVNDVFARAGAGAQDLAYATVEVVTPGARVWAYASVVDNGTGDPTMVPMIVQ